MTILQELTYAFKDQAVASEIIESLLDNGLEIDAGSVEVVPRGYTGARLAKAILVNANGSPDPRWCVMKYCPPAPDDHQRESRRHHSALQDSPKIFRERHLTEVAFPVIRCPQNAFVIGQSLADGIPLGRVELDQLSEACEVVWREILEGWSGRDYNHSQSTVATLLESELGGSFKAGGWLREWALQHDLLVPAFLELPGESEPLPNPWRLFSEDSPATQARVHYLVGRTHGDLHGDNILVPLHDKTVRPADFRLIDLTTYEARAPLSRDLAALLISLCWREIGVSSPRTRQAFLTYLERDHGDSRLHDEMPGNLRKIIDALRKPTLDFVVEKGWNPEHWHRQLKVSLLAQAMLHSAYTSGPPSARRWCSRLASRLTRVLLGPGDPQAHPSMPFDAGISLKAAETTAAQTARHSTRGKSVFVNRSGQRSRLRAALEDDVTSVIVVSGPAGIGKTALVREVLTELGWADPENEGSPLRWHDATPYGDLGVPTLVKDIEPPGLDQIAGPTARARLEIAMDGLSSAVGVRPVIVLDSAENLLKEGNVLRDSELDLALESIHGRLYPLVKVVFITQYVPEVTTNVAWTETACRISLEGLEPPSLGEYFAALDPNNRYGLVSLPDNDLRRIHGRLAGNPRFAELLHAILSIDPPGLDAREVGPWLASVPAGEVHQRLVRRFVDHLPAEQQRAAEALAALGIPVTIDAVIRVIAQYVPAAKIENALQALVSARLVLERRDGRRYLRKSEIGAIIGRLDRGDHYPHKGESPTQLGLLLKAAKVLQSMQKDDDDVHSMADLEMRFARVDVWLRAGMHGAALSLIESMHELVQFWGSGSGTELSTQREAVRGRLGDDREGEMMNVAALGDIYSYRNDFPAARAAYAVAITIAKENQDRQALRRIYIGMGQMFWEHDYLTEAEEHYGRALGLADEDDDDDGDRAAALTGLADCRQRQGNYRRAVTDALEAYVAAGKAEPRVALDAAFRLTRWYAELNQIPDALTMLARCEELISTYPDPAARAELLITTADLHLYQDRYVEARLAAEQAVDVARIHRQPINLRRSLATLALTLVHLDDLAGARKAIEESSRYRVAGQETVELALRGIIAHRSGLPATARDLFQQLRDETKRRVETDSSDLAAWDFSGIAQCYLVLIGDAEPGKALEAFRQARPDPAERTPGLDDRLRFMVEILADGNPRLGPVLTGLACTRPRRAG
ncbi:hypothetical protein ACN27J_14810 [Solwaraspora sp. WMMB762]|uniref:hypothetical protein n=1 Tax=Solwaraspora sp. WMMB762 TaxID=3404120 RepID=UPI003B94E3C0